MAFFMLCFYTWPHTYGINYYPVTDSKTVTPSDYFFLIIETATLYDKILNC